MERFVKRAKQIIRVLKIYLKALRAWLQDVLVAVEHFYPTLALVDMNVHDKTGRVEQDFDKSMLEELNRFSARKTFWEGSEHTCRGKVS